MFFAFAIIQISVKFQNIIVSELLIVEWYLVPQIEDLGPFFLILYSLIELFDFSKYNSEILFFLKKA